MRYNPALRLEGKNPFLLDSKAPSISLKQYAYQEARYTMLVRSDPEAARELLKSGAGRRGTPVARLLQPRRHGRPLRSRLILPPKRRSLHRNR